MITLEELSPIIFGGGAFNNVQYGADSNLDPEGSLETAFKGGINAIDTSAYYGDSEIILGKALKNLSDQFPRESYFICSKAGRWETNKFDYSPESIRSCVERSLQRLGTSYLDALLVHDVEFKSHEDALTALKTAFHLKAQGKVRYVGFSGLPLEYLSELALLAKDQLQSVDLILSYCNLTIQNRLLLQYKSKFEAADVKLVMNASPLGMSLLRSDQTHDWHPASKDLKQKTYEIAQELNKDGIELADMAEQYSFSEWSPTVVGMRSPAEVTAALENLQKSSTIDDTLVKHIQDSFGELMDTIWYSGVH